MTDAGEVDEQMPDEMEIGVLWLGIEECAGRVHEPAQDDEDEEPAAGRAAAASEGRRRRTSPSPYRSPSKGWDSCACRWP